jgi:hypothetical protein
MRRTALLLVLMASVLLAASGVAWAVTKTCPPSPKDCWGTNGADVLKSTSKANFMLGKKGNDTYTNFVRGNSGIDDILDYGGRDKLVLSNYSASEVKYAEVDYLNKNGKADTLFVYLGKGTQNVLIIGAFFDDTRSKPPYNRGFGFIEVIQTK